MQRSGFNEDEIPGLLAAGYRKQELRSATLKRNKLKYVRYKKIIVTHWTYLEH